MQAGVIVAIVFAILVSIFALQNAQPVDIKFITLQGEASLALVILISVAVGAVILGMLNLYSRLKSGNSMKKLSKEKSALEKEITDLKGQIAALQQQISSMEESTKPKEEAPPAQTPPETVSPESNVTPM